MATAGSWIDGEPEKPTKEDFDAHAKVERYHRWMGHQFSLNRGRFDIRYEHGMPAMAVTEYGESEMTDDVWRQAGYVPVEDADGKQVGWTSTPGWR